jgi:hypothetical protein
MSQPKWLVPFIPGGRHDFDFVNEPQGQSCWHTRKKRTTGLSEWLKVGRHATAAWQRRRGHGGVIALFPQAAAAIGSLKRLTRSSSPIVAYHFNLGRRYTGTKGALQRIALRRVERLVVHSRRECQVYSELLEIPPDRFRFIPLQCGFHQTTLSEDTERPFLLAMGSANRDYRTLFSAIDRLKIRTLVVAGAHALEGLAIPSCVEERSGLSLTQCRELAQRARLSVIPVAVDETASGQVTVVEAMRMGRPVIATRCAGTEDYIDSGRTGILVPMGSSDALRKAIGDLWEDHSTRSRISANARQHAHENYSDEAAGRNVGHLLDELADSVA